MTRFPAVASCFQQALPDYELRASGFSRARSVHPVLNYRGVPIIPELGSLNPYRRNSRTPGITVRISPQK